MNNKNDSFYYVILNDDDFGDLTIAKLDSETKQFYDYHSFEFFNNCSDYKLGEKVELNSNGEVVKTDNSISKKVLQIIAEDKIFYDELEKKYNGIRFNSQNVPPHIDYIISMFAKDRNNNGLPVDLYVVDILRILSSAMGLRVRYGSGGRLYDQISSFNYPEELYEVVSAMYDIISEKLANNEKIRFELYEYRCMGEEFNKFREELERRTRYSKENFRSDLEDRISDEAYHGVNWGYSQRRYDLSCRKPTMIITPNETIYYHDRATDKAIVESTTRKTAEERLGHLLKKNNKNLINK